MPLLLGHALIIAFAYLTLNLILAEPAILPLKQRITNDQGLGLGRAHAQQGGRQQAENEGRFHGRHRETAGCGHCVSAGQAHQ